MAYSQEVREKAYALDPECWISYSGKPRRFKQEMDSRRSEALAKASWMLREYEVPEEIEKADIVERLEELENRLDTAMSALNRTVKILEELMESEGYLK